ncbi:MAG TPA: hypothetical protein V6D15_16000 [Oculatellaceae cyanobacterium]|jgi:hypothetical protein
MQHLLSLTKSLDKLRFSLPNLLPASGLENLNRWHTPSALLYLYQEFFPENWYASSSSLYPQEPDIHSPRELEFINNVNQQLFPLDEWDLELANSQEQYLDRIPVPALGIDWAYCLSNEEMSLDELEVPLQLLLPLTDCGNYACISLGANQWYTDVWEINLQQLPSRSCIDENLLNSLCAVYGEPITFLLEVLNVLDYNTNNPLLDFSHETEEAKWFDWNPENLRTLAQAYQEVPPILERVFALFEWLETDNSNFHQILQIWNNSVRKF